MCYDYNSSTSVSCGEPWPTTAPTSPAPRASPSGGGTWAFNDLTAVVLVLACVVLLGFALLLRRRLSPVASGTAAEEPPSTIVSSSTDDGLHSVQFHSVQVAPVPTCSMPLLRCRSAATTSQQQQQQQQQPPPSNSGSAAVQAPPNGDGGERSARSEEARTRREHHLRLIRLQTSIHTIPSASTIDPRQPVRPPRRQRGPFSAATIESGALLSGGVLRSDVWSDERSEDFDDRSTLSDHDASDPAAEDD
jgi:hypothetical protein